MILQISGIPSLIPQLTMIAGLALITLVAIGFPDDILVAGAGLFLSGLTAYFIEPLSSIFGIFLGFVIYTALFFVLWRRYSRTEPINRGSTSDAGDLEGMVGVVSEEIPSHGKGMIHLRENSQTYVARSHSDVVIEKGTEVMVMDPGGGTILHVSPIPEEEIEYDLET